MANSVEMKKLEFIIPRHSTLQLNVEFVDVSLSSEDEIPAKEIEEWRAFKSIGSKSLTDSVGMMSTLLHSERKISVYSKPGSIIDSFAVGYPVSMNK